ncbi:MAG: c-type cytochrome [Pseudomonadota bacterium]
MSPKIHLISVLSLLFLFTNDLYADVSVGKQIYQHCKVCHGLKGLGGKEGKYPRIAGLPQPYIEKQLSDFKSRKRLNKPMVPVFKNWRFNKDAIASVASYVTQLSLDELTIPAHEPAPEILAQFDSPDEMREVGEDIFQDCIQCHGEQAAGKADKESPPLVNQYPNYLRKQIGDFASGRRTHENSESLFAELEADEVEALIAYVTMLSSGK